jgi:adhesin transport system membrane fusion protein
MKEIKSRLIKLGAPGPDASESNVGESAARYRASLVNSARLMPKLTICRWSSDELNAWPDLSPPKRAFKPSAAQTRGFAWLNSKMRWSLVNKELAITERLAKAVPPATLRCCVCNGKSDIGIKLTDLRSQYFVQVREALSKANAEVECWRLF